MSRARRYARPRPHLSLDQLVEAAIALLDEEGLDGLTTRALAARLGVQSPALYWYIRDKGELLDLVADAICAPVLDATTGAAAGPATDPDSGPATSPDREPGWREQVAEGLRSYRAVLRSHRDAPRLLAERPPVGPVRRRLADNTVSIVTKAGFSEAEAAVMSILLAAYVISIVSEEMRLEARATRIALGEEISREDSGDTRSLARIAAVDPETLFETSLEVLLDGIEQRLRRRQAGHA